MRYALLCLSFVNILVVQVSAWALHSSCTGDTATRVTSTMDVVFTVLEYASKRAQDKNLIQADATLLQDLIGAPDEHHQATLDLAHSKFRKFAALFQQIF